MYTVHYVMLGGHELPYTWQGLLTVIFPLLLAPLFLFAFIGYKTHETKPKGLRIAVLLASLFILWWSIFINKQMIAALIVSFVLWVAIGMILGGIYFLYCWLVGKDFG